MGGNNCMQFANSCLAELKPGNIVRVRRILYWHYGIFCGENKIVHLTSYPNHIWQTGAEVKMTSIYEFLKSSNKIEVFCYSDTKSYRIVKNAYERLGERKYSIFKYNCRHFVLSCAE